MIGPDSQAASKPAQKRDAQNHKKGNFKGNQSNKRGQTKPQGAFADALAAALKK